MVPSILKTSMGNDGAFWFQAYQKLVWGSMVPNGSKCFTNVLSCIINYDGIHNASLQIQTASDGLGCRI